MPPVLSPADSTVALDELRQKLHDALGPRRFQNWFGPSTRLVVDGDHLVVQVASPYVAKWIQGHFEKTLRGLIAEILGAGIELRYVVDAEIRLTPAPTDAVDAPQLVSHSRKTEVAAEPTTEARRRKRRVYSLQDFVVGESNELAVAAIQRLLCEGDSISPVYLHGGVGTGKTHLLHGLYGRLKKEAPHLQCVTLTAEQFANYFTQALGGKSLPSFRARFRNVDVLLIDDVDFFDGKKGFQEEFLHTLKQFESQGRTVVVTSDRHPRLLTETCDELVSRFLSGIACRLEAPDEEVRMEIVRRHVARRKARFAGEAMTYIASKFKSNVRELEGAVNLLTTWGEMANRMVTLTAAKRLLGKLERDCLKVIRMGDIENAVCEFFGVPSAELRSNSRKKSVSQPRMVAMFLARQMTQTAYHEIGSHFGGRNHSTVMSAERKIRSQLEGAAQLRVASEQWTLQDVLETLQDRIKAG